MLNEIQAAQLTIVNEYLVISRNARRYVSDVYMQFQFTSSALQCRRSETVTFLLLHSN